MKKSEEILKNVLLKVKPKEEDLTDIENNLKYFLEKIEGEIRKNKIDAEIFVGGSYAKKTLMEKDKYDVDIFLRFKNEEEIQEGMKKIISDLGEVKIIHGSRDYFSFKVSENLEFEVIPVRRVKKPEESENVTDLSYMHVKYVNKKIKSQKLLDEILIAKAFCYAKKCYGAESYISGFSGYAIELLVYYYGGFLKFLKEISKIKEKEIIDIEKSFKRKKDILLDLNSSKLGSPIILIDPTFKYRNVLAALSEETFRKFQGKCKEFLKNPSEEDFELEKTDLNKIKEDAKNNGNEFILLEVKTEKQEGDVAGSKLLKFYNHLTEQISKYFEIKDKGFNYNGKKSARYYFVVKNKEEILFEGPSVKDTKNVKAFEKVHKDYFTKNGRIYAKEKIGFNLEEFVKNIKNKDKKRIKEMYIEKIEII